MQSLRQFLSTTNFLSLGIAFILSLIFTFSFLFGSYIFGFIIGDFFLDHLLPDPWIASLTIPHSTAFANYYSALAAFTPIASLLLWIFILLVILGFCIDRFRFSFLGSVFLYLPTFSQIGFKMYFFAGAGVFCLIWLPLLEISPDLLRLGEIINFPLLLFYQIYEWDSYFFYNLVQPLFPLYVILIGFLGTFLLTYGMISWLYGRFNNQPLVDFWIYRYSRHPQYLGILLLTWTVSFYFSAGWFWSPPTPPSTFFLLFSFFILGKAIHEENKLLQVDEFSYAEYRLRSPFLLPLPKVIRSGFPKFNTIIIKKEWPESNREIAVLLLSYGLIVVLVSILLIIIFPVEYGRYD
jgi:protein-S-isoprenylcysteine O-methyltransferase Ste14